MFGFVEWTFIGMFVGFCVLDTILKAYAYPKIRGWQGLGILSFVLYFLITGYGPILWDQYLGAHTLFDASQLSLWVSIPVGFIVLQFRIYVWHRTMHNVGFLWRYVHQMHHAPERLDIYGAFYFHPLDMFGWAFVGSFMLVGIFGLSGEAGAIVNLSAAFCSMFQHANIKTPRWLGFLVTRPESHSIHHKKDHHAQNYGDVPLFDMIFRTFVNPHKPPEEVGFGEGSTLKIGPALVGSRLA